MSILIAHRGNVDGPSPKWENHPHHLLGCMALYPDIHYEIDVWLIDNQWFLGHDAPQHPVDLDFLINARFWCHAKNFTGYQKMLTNPLIHCFWHQEDDYVLTSRGFIWTYPGKVLGSNSICVMPELTPDLTIPNVAGICTDYIDRYR